MCGLRRYDVGMGHVDAFDALIDGDDALGVDEERIFILRKSWREPETR